MDIVVFGEDGFTGIVIDSLVQKSHNVMAVITPFYDTTIYMNLERVANKHQISFYRIMDVNSDHINYLLNQLGPDLIISVHLRKILHKNIFSKAKIGAINVHPSQLPKYRGMSPQHQAIIHGDKEMGVTVHFIEEGADTGRIIIQDTFPIANNDYIADVQLKVMEVYKTIVIRSVDLIAQGFKGFEQNLSTLSYFGPVKKIDREIQLNKSAKEILNLIRAFSLPYKGAFINEFTIWSADFPSAFDENGLKQRYLVPGIYLEEDTLIIRSIDGVLVSNNYEITE